MKLNRLFILSSVLIVSAMQVHAQRKGRIDRYALVHRNSPQIKEFEELSSLSVGNGNFAFTVDATGFQTFPEFYSQGVPLGTQSQWGWHSFRNDQHFKHTETLKNYNFRGWEEPYSTQFNEAGRQKDASEYFRTNAHRLHLGSVGLELPEAAGKALIPADLKAVAQTLDLWTGTISSRFNVQGDSVSVRTACDPVKDEMAFRLHSSLLSKGKLAVRFRFAYPTGKHTDDACDWNSPALHSTDLLSSNEHSVVLKRRLDATIYYVLIKWTGKAGFSKKADHYFVLKPAEDNISLTVQYLKQEPVTAGAIDEVFASSAAYWTAFWKKGGVADFSRCTDPRAPELERRVVLSQYLLAIQCAGDYPPQETGLTYNSWFGKFHLEMHWWHAAQFALWNRPQLLERSLGWYGRVLPVARNIAERQKFKGVRWMKMTDTTGVEAPSKVGSFLAWQQPHIIYMAELIYRTNPSREVLERYDRLIEETAAFMASFVSYDELEGRYVLKGLIAAQETLKASETINPPFELSYWHFALSVAQQWRERLGKARKVQWDEIIDKLSPLAYNQDKLYLASEDAVDTYKDIRFTSDHMAVLGAVGVLPVNKLIRPDYMRNTLKWIYNNWNWGKTWGWDYPMTAMDAARLGEPEIAVNALLMNKRTNTYLVNGHNYQDSRLRIYLPGNGALLNAVALMCAGWDGSKLKNPGFPRNGKWNVMWEDIKAMP